MRKYNSNKILYHLLKKILKLPSFMNVEIDCDRFIIEESYIAAEISCNFFFNSLSFFNFSFGLKKIWTKIKNLEA